MTSSAVVRIGVGTRLVHDGEQVQIVETRSGQTGMDVTVKNTSTQALTRSSLHDLLMSEGTRLITDSGGPCSNDDADVAAVILAQLSDVERQAVVERAGHVREVLSGFRSGSEEFAASGEPRPEYRTDVPLSKRYASKARELGAGKRTVQRWVAQFQRHGEAGLVPAANKKTTGLGSNVDSRWVDIAIEVMVEHADQSRPSQTLVIKRTNARTVARFGDGIVDIPSRATAFRVLAELEKRYPTFRLSTKRNRDIAARPDGVYGKLRPTRPGEYMLMDTTRLDVFALDPITLRWVQVELTIAMDWYTRCITGIRLTPVSTKSVDAAVVLYQAYRPRPAGRNWPPHAVWPEHGVPHSVLIDTDAVDGSFTGAAGPAIVPETVVIDHGKIFVSEHMTSVCLRLGISIQPARLRTGRDKGPVERFFRTIREDLLQILPGYKGPDIHSRGLDPQAEAFFYIDELEAIIRDWVAIEYHHRPHDSLIDPQVPGLRMSPAQMFDHGLARAGYIEAPRDRNLAYEFLKTEWRTIQHYGVELDKRVYNGPALNEYRNMTSPYTGKAKGRWPIHYDPDDVTRAYFRDPKTREWHPLVWEHAPSMDMPFSEDALEFARKLAADKYTYPNDTLAVADLFERWNLGLGSTLAERRMALRLSRAARLIDEAEPADQIAALPAVARVLAISAPVGSDEQPEAASDIDPESGDDDTDDDADEAVDEFDYTDDSFYADALEDA